MKYILTSYSSQPSKNKAGSIREMNPNEYIPYDEELILKNPNIRIVCDCCLKNITVICHIASDDYDYCVACFSQLDQFPENYIVRSTMMYSLTQPSWTCLDQILLLTAFQKWGFGNWGEVKDYMNFNGSKFTKIQIQEHYDQYYLETHNLHPKVDAQVVEITKANSAQQAKRFLLNVGKKNESKPILQLKSEQILSLGKKAPITTQCNILGYNPKRKCFYYDIQYDEKAQTMLADLEFQDDDSPEQIQLKFNIIDNYNNRLDERLKRYQFTIDHHILDIDYRFKQEFSASKYQKQAFQLYRPFTRFLSHEKNQQAMQLIAEGNHCKSLIQGLKMCRKKIDKEGKIQTTLQYLNSKEDNAEKWGNPRKIYHIELDEPCETVSQELLKKFEASIKKYDQSETIHSLKVIYKSSNI